MLPQLLIAVNIYIDNVYTELYVGGTRGDNLLLNLVLVESFHIKKIGANSKLCYVVTP